MDLLLTCERNCAKYVSLELKNRGIKGKITEFESCVVANDVLEKDAIKATYLMQTPLRVIWLLGQTKIPLTLEGALLEIKKLVEKIDYKIFDKDNTFSVRTQRNGLHEFNSVDLSQETGLLIKEECKKQTKIDPKVDMKTPKLPFFLYIDETNAWFGIDMVGKDLSKRDYKVFNNPHSIKGVVAASLLLACDWNPQLSLLDPFASGGVIGIEAALMATNQSVRFYDKKFTCKNFFDITKELEKLDGEKKQVSGINSIDSYLPNITAAKKNSKLAGVEKSVSFSKMDLEWVDTKFEKEEMDRIICQPLEPSKHVLLKRATKLTQELFEAAKYVLKKNGKIGFLCSQPEFFIEIAKKQKFKKTKQEMIWTGHLQRWILVFEK